MPLGPPSTRQGAECWTSSSGSLPSLPERVLPDQNQGRKEKHRRDGANAGQGAGSRGSADHRGRSSHRRRGDDAA